MSDPAIDAAGMKLRNLTTLLGSKGAVVAQFGEASLIRQPDGKWHLKGGSRNDRMAAREWTSLFIHEAILPAK